MRRFTLTLLVGLLGVCFAWAQPSDNPYRTFYQINGGVHWTDSLAWTNIQDVTTFGATPNDANDDLAAINQAIDAAHLAGGGVVYFPAGDYIASDDIMLKSGVVLRGAGANHAEAKKDGYRPSSKIEFPRYTLDKTANGGNGNPNSSAFKVVFGDTSGCENVAVVDLWLNGAPMIFHPKWEPKAGHNKRQPATLMRNVLLFGNLNTNAALADPSVPKRQQNGWQRYSYRFCSNIDVNVKENGVVVNNRINDTTVASWNFNQPGYIVEERGKNQWKEIEKLPDHNSNLPAGYQARFDYMEHYGITLNRFKKWRISDGSWKIDGHKHFPSPTEEPDLFAPGNIIADNYVFNTMRVGIYAAGNGLKILRNKTRMDPEHQRIQTRIAAPTGRVTPQGATTFENRGLDFAGYNVVCSYNDYRVYRDKIQSYLSTDGEGILTQECCGGTQINSAIVDHNVGNTYIGLYKMRDIFNSSVSYNHIDDNIFFVANTNNDPYGIYDTRIVGNRAEKMQVLGSTGGRNLLIDSNIAAPGNNTINHSCYATIGNANSQAFSYSIPSSEGGAPCLEANAVEISITRPSKDVLISEADYRGTVTVTAQLANYARPRRISGVWYINGKVADANATFNWSDSTSSLTFLPLQYGSSVGITLVVRDSSFFNFAHGISGTTIFSPTRMIRMQPVPKEDSTTTIGTVTTDTISSSPATSLDQVVDMHGSFSVYPNPTSDKVYVEGELGTISRYQVLNSKGQVVKEADFNGPGIRTAIDLSGMDRGLYIIKMLGIKTAYTHKVMKE